MATGTGDGSSFSLWKLQHDMQQLEFLTRSKLSSLKIGLPELQSLYSLYSELHLAVVQQKPEEQVFLHFQKLSGIFNRALHVHSPTLVGGALLTPAASRLRSWRPEAALMVDEAIDESTRHQIYWSLLSSTIWYGAREGREAVLLSATLLEGLHHHTLLSLSREVRSSLPPGVRGYPLRDVVARKYHASRPNPGTELHSWDGEVVACLWLHPSSPSTGGELRILHNEAPPHWSEEEAFDWAHGNPRPSLEKAVSVDLDVRPQPRRLAIWSGRRLVQTLPSTSDWPPVRYEESWIEVYFLFGSQRRWASKIDPRPSTGDAEEKSQVSSFRHGERGGGVRCCTSQIDS